MVLDYSMMQWVLSIVVGVSLSRFINTIALIGGKKDQVKFDFLLISILFATTTQMIHVWFNSPGYFQTEADDDFSVEDPLGILAGFLIVVK